MSADTPEIGNVSTSLAELPSINYATAKDTLVYRLSELTFGSLLAAYILGFISFTSSSLSQTDTSLWQITINFLTYVFISSSFSYLTAALYMQYHSGILTMPTAAVERSRYDFTIAILQAILFGISMLVPQSFFLCTAVILSVTTWRQKWEFTRLTDYFTDAIRPSNRSQRASPNRAEKLDTAQRSLKDAVKKAIICSKLQGWRPVSIGHYLGTAILAIAGTCALVPTVSPGFLTSRPNLLAWLPVLYAVSYFVLFALVVRGALHSMKIGAQFGEAGLKVLDNNYHALEDKLRNLEPVKSMNQEGL